MGPINANDAKNLALNPSQASLKVLLEPAAQPGENSSNPSIKASNAATQSQAINHAEHTEPPISVHPSNGLAFNLPADASLAWLLAVLGGRWHRGRDNKNELTDTGAAYASSSLIRSA